MPEELLSEASGSVLADDKTTPGKFRVAIMEGGRWGSSGFYPEEVVERDGPNVFREGTPIFLDHPTKTELKERPERSVRDRAGKIVSTPSWDSNTKTLQADVQFYESYSNMLSEMWGDVGLSIRATGTCKQGTAQGRKGKIVESLTKSASVDVVTQAGAGGAILHATESANPQSLDSKEDAVPETTVDTEALGKLTTAVTAMTEAFQEAQKKQEEMQEAARKAAEENKVDPLDISLKVSQSGLPKAYMTRVIEAVKGGAEVDKALTEAKDELKSVLEEVAKPDKKDKPNIGAPGNMTESGKVETAAGEVDISESAIDNILKNIVGSEK